MVGLGVAIGGYNMLGIQMYDFVDQIKQLLLPEPCHGKLCLPVTTMCDVLVVSGQPQTYSA